MQIKSPIEVLGAIRMYMYIHDISQDELAQKLGKSKQTVSSIFASKKMTATTLFEMVNALNIPVFFDVEEASNHQSSDSDEDSN